WGFAALNPSYEAELSPRRTLSCRPRESGDPVATESAVITGSRLSPRFRGGRPGRQIWVRFVTLGSFRRIGFGWVRSVRLGLFRGFCAPRRRAAAVRAQPSAGVEATVFTCQTAKAALPPRSTL